MAITDEQKQQLSAMPYWDDYLCFPQPCWHNIYPGNTSMSEAFDIIQADPELQPYPRREKNFTWQRVGHSQAGGYIETSYKHPGIVFGIYIGEADEHQFCLKDAVTIYGTPLALYYVSTEGIKADGIYVYFRGNVVARVYDPLNPTIRNLYPTSSIVQMLYWSTIYKVPAQYLWSGYSQAS